MGTTENRQRDEHGRLLPVPEPTDRSRYAMGDRDPKARAARTAAAAAARKATRRGPLDDQDKRTTAIQFRMYGHGAPRVKFNLSARETAALDTAAGETGRAEYIRITLLQQHGIGDTAALDRAAERAGVIRSRFLRDAILAALGITDTAPRAAERKPRATRRQAKQQGSKK